MNKKLMTFLAVIGTLICLSINAQQAAPAADTQVGGTSSVAIGAWKLGLGASYRNFHTVELKGKSVVNDTYMFFADEGPSKIQKFDENIVSGNRFPKWLDPNGNAYYRPERAYIVEAGTYLYSGSGDFGFQESLAPVLSLEFDFYQDENLTLGAISNFQFFSLDTAGRTKGRSVDEMTHWALLQYNGSGVPTYVDGYQQNPEYTSYNSSYLMGTGKTKFDLDLYVIDFGIQLGYTFSNGFDLTLAAGPSITLADMESSSGRIRDNDIDITFGAYVAGGVNFWFNEKFGIGFDVRYDEVFEHVDTHYANLNLDSWSAMLKFLIIF